MMALFERLFGQQAVRLARITTSARRIILLASVMRHTSFARRGFWLQRRRCCSNDSCKHPFTFASSIACSSHHFYANADHPARIFCTQAKDCKTRSSRTESAAATRVRWSFGKDTAREV